MWKDVIKNGKPDYLDFDGDGDTEEPMVDALKTVEQVESVKKTIATLDDTMKKLAQVRGDISKGKLDEVFRYAKLTKWEANTVLARLIEGIEDFMLNEGESQMEEAGDRAHMRSRESL